METPEALGPGVAMRPDAGMRSLVVAAGLFVSLFLPWVGPISGWALRTGAESGMLALAVVLVELLRLTGAWLSRGAHLVAFCLTAAAGIMGVTNFVTLRWGAGGQFPFSAFRYGAWLALALAILLAVLALRQMAELRRPAP